MCRLWGLLPPTAMVAQATHWKWTTDSARCVFCPACKKIKEKYPSGELHMVGVDPKDRREVLRILRNEEKQAREKNPLERIMQLEALNGEWKVQTTTEKLAQRLGRSLHKARGGRLAYKWSHNNKFVRVFWEGSRG
ncbi:MAG TPA: BCAM0308 family protein [Candidatus Binatia bacterium]|nr:BCAM0308 family protein [Candidatus Binatia bacterium]